MASPLSVHFTVSAGTYDASTFTLSCGGASAAGSLAVAGGVTTFTPTNSIPFGNCSFIGTVTGKGENGGASIKKDFSVTFATEPMLVYHCARLNLVIFAVQSGSIGVINGETVTPLVNKSEFTGNARRPLALCALWDTLRADGRPLASCGTRIVGNTRRNFPINPLTGEVMTEYKGALPVGGGMRDVGDSSRTAPPDHVAANVPFYGMYIDVPSVGSYYFTGTDSVNLHLTTDGFATNKIIHVGDHKFLATYTNP